MMISTFGSQERVELTQQCYDDGLWVSGVDGDGEFDATIWVG